MSVRVPRNWDVWLLATVVIANAAWNVVYLALVQNNTYPICIESVYEKIKISLTSTSILIAVAGIPPILLRDRVITARLKAVASKTLAWLLVALFCGIITVAILPTSIAPSGFLQHRHAALWMWLYITGPLMYGGLLIGAGAFLRMVYALLEQGE